ncbi:MAG: hypothetical protein LUI85_03390 [Bacteroides sp.]|nr:hypothetical protein [Bacteroides sp.]
MKNYLLFILSLFFSCSSPKQEKDFLSIPSTPIHGVAYEEEIMSSEEGTPYLVDSCFLICMPDPKNVCLVLDRQTGKEITRLGKYGGGPGEFSYPIVAGTSSNNDTLYIANMPNKVELFTRKQKGFYQFLEEKSIKLKKMEFMTDIIRISDGYYVITTLSGGKEFFILLDSNLHEIKRFGHHPIKGMTAEANSFMRFQGRMTSYKNSFYFATMFFGYIARYDISNNGDVTLIWEKMVTPPKCNIYEANIGIRTHENRDGFYGLAANNKYLFATYSGIFYAAADTDPSACVPKTLVAFSTSGELIGEYALDHKSSQVCLSENGDNLYIWSSNPEVTIERFSVKEILNIK